MNSPIRRVVRPLVVRFSIRNRNRKAAFIADWMTAHGCKTVLFVGSSGTENITPNENIVELELARRFDVVMGVNLTPRTTPYPFQVADGRDMPFPDRWVDFALANAIIEHVGDEADQRQFVREQTRVARCWAITTPNRWFPIESHTEAVLRHWSASWRARQQRFTRLLSRKEFVALLPTGTEVIGRRWSPTFVALWDADRAD